jgi:hypothetical protein
MFGLLHHTGSLSHYSAALLIHIIKVGEDAMACQSYSQLCVVVMLHYNTQHLQCIYTHLASCLLLGLSLGSQLYGFFYGHNRYLWYFHKADNT